MPSRQKNIFCKKETEKLELVTSPGGKQATFAMTTYEADPKREVFGDAGDQTEEFSDENKSIVWFLVKQVQHTIKKITQGNTQGLLSALGPYLWSSLWNAFKTQQDWSSMIWISLPSVIAMVDFMGDI